MLTKVALSAAAGLLLVVLLIGQSVAAVVDGMFGGSTGGVADCASSVADIPAEYCLLYGSAASSCPGLDWSVLAAVGKVESDHGRAPLPGVHSGENFAGAGGPMQFLAATFAGVVAQHRLPAGGASPPSRYDPHDAVHAAAFYLCDSGAGRGDLRAAVFAYNHADWYVDLVLDHAAEYARTAGTGCGGEPPRTPAAVDAVRYACAQRGLPYVWGGDGPEHGHAGFDCSGLVKAAYGAAGIGLPRTAQQQFDAGPLVPPGEALLPGDLVFYGTPGAIHHVGLYVGAGLMVNAPTFGQPVQVDRYRYPGDDYAGATRPTGLG
ncbi:MULTISPECIES: bifunctional lytic transglycosylase/C40 family peptidase [Actinosynnema]|uniref:C40 family peptidase n=1 Tax=Actinosynnema TaxID=40566 RepID=UPI0020A3B1E9|nr:bifunctional lytic transglycosylase/C40 family peptidase [Actinosynnema pretiosum]MCP2094700.1 Cell wall-associated hydrolase, NlpC family [Actinosynnema pretiosum]